MKKFIIFVILLGLLDIAYIYRENIIHYIVFNFIYTNNTMVEQPNNYYKDANYEFVQNTKSLIPHTKEDIINIIYSGLNRGLDIIEYYCEDVNYKTCMSDSASITSNQELLSSINDYVHPFNSYTKLSIQTNNLGRIKILVNKLYSDDEINAINNKVDEIINNNINDSMSTREKIKVIHDYIINNTSYDTEAKIIDNTHVTLYKSQKAYGALIEGKAICGGYSDATAILLDRLNIPNYKVASYNHVWNLVYVDNAWYHLDLTWDDPVVNTGDNILLNNYFLITTEQLLNNDTTQHTFNKEYFIEAEKS